jgi:hypothetical protein
MSNDSRSGEPVSVSRSSGEHPSGKQKKVVVPCSGLCLQDTTKLLHALWSSTVLYKNSWQVGLWLPLQLQIATITTLIRSATTVLWWRLWLWLHQLHGPTKEFHYTAATMTSVSRKFESIGFLMSSCRLHNVDRQCRCHSGRPFFTLLCRHSISSL